MTVPAASRTSRTAAPSRAVVAVALSVAIAGCGLPAASPTRASAAPPASSPASGTAGQVQQKQAQQAAVLGEIDMMRTELSVSMADYVTVAKQIEETEREIDSLDVQINDLDASLMAGQRELADRAVELYRSQRVSMLEVLLASRSLQDLITRAEYLSRISRKDARLIDDIRLSRQESAWLQTQLEEKRDKLTALEQSADAQRESIEGAIAQRQARVVQIQREINQISGTNGLFSGGRPIGGFDPNTVISETSFRASTSMTAEQIQAFLNRQPGSLKYYRAPDHAGRTVSAAEMVAEAAQAWGVSPAVILVTLQKEQSLLARANPTQNAYDWAMGCGKADSRTFYQYQGFGKQVWFGAQKLQQNSAPWKPGITMTIDGDRISPSNSATYSLYKYTPHFPGVTRFWLLYWRYFGDPMR